MSAFTDALGAAESGADVLVALAHGHDPKAVPPTPEALAEWWPELPDPERLRSGNRLRKLSGASVWADMEGFDPRPALALFSALMWDRTAPPDLDGVALAITRGWLAVRAAVPDRGPGHPFGPIVAAWLARPPVVAAESRRDPLLPVVRSVTEAPERTAGRLALGGIGGQNIPAGGAQLPLIPSPPGPRVPLLEVADMRGGPIMARGRGAPLDLRLLVAVCVLLPHRTRAARGTLDVTVRELRDFLFPNRWQRGRDWPAVQAALWKAHNYMIPGRFRFGSGIVDGWVPFRLRGGAGDGAVLDDHVLIDVELPPGSAHGPRIDRPELTQLGVESAPRFRAYIAAHSIAWIPGRTRIPYPGGGPPRLWSGDPGKYPVLTAGDRRGNAFSDGDRSHRTVQEQDAAWENLPGTVILTRKATTPDGHRGWLIVPEGAAAAIRKRRERELPNRGTGAT